MATSLYFAPTYFAHILPAARTVAGTEAAGPNAAGLDGGLRRPGRLRGNPRRPRGDRSLCVGRLRDPARPAGTGRRGDTARLARARGMGGVRRCRPDRDPPSRLLQPLPPHPRRRPSLASQPSCPARRRRSRRPRGLQPRRWLPARTDPAPPGQPATRDLSTPSRRPGSTESLLISSLHPPSSVRTRRGL